MKETKFIEQNHKKWNEFEALLRKDYKEPEKLRRLFVEITDDLSYSRTYYPNRSVRVYINGLAQQIFFNIYKNKLFSPKSFISFWTHELPQLVYEARKEFVLSFVIFLGSFLIGILSCYMNPDFAEVILGEDYINMTLENIEADDPMAVYKSRGQLDMAFSITLNNLRVAFLTFTMGIFYAIGTIFILISNGVMVGAFQFFFIERGLFWESFSTIWIHGTIEISSIIIAGAAGLVMGGGLVFPKTHSRLQSFQISARRGIKIMLGVVPLFIVAGILEGFVTRLTDMPDFFKLFIIIGSLVFMYFYWWVYPQMVAKDGNIEPINDIKLKPDELVPIGKGLIKTSGEVFQEVFVFIRNRLSFLLGFSALLAIIPSLLLLFLYGDRIDETIRFTRWSFFNFRFDIHFQNLGQFFDFSNNGWSFVVLSLILSIGVYGTSQMVSSFLKESRLPQAPFSMIGSYLQTLMLVSAYSMILLIDFPLATFGYFLGLPILIIICFVQIHERTNVFSAIGRSFFLLSGSFGRLYGLYFIFCLVGFLVSFIIDSEFLLFMFQIIKWNVYLDADSTNELLSVLFSISSFFVFSLLLSAMVIGFGILYETLVELREATFLKERVMSLGKKRMIKGMEREIQ